MMKPIEVTHFCRWVIAKDYYDGATTGIAECHNKGSWIYFSVIAWDKELWERVFAYANADLQLVVRLRQILERSEDRREPFWLPGPAAATPEIEAAWASIRSTTLESESWELAAGHDLLEPVEMTTLSSAASKSVAELVRRKTVIGIENEPVLMSVLNMIVEP